MSKKKKYSEDTEKVINKNGIKESFICIRYGLAKLLSCQFVDVICINFTPCFLKME